MEDNRTSKQIKGALAEQEVQKHYESLGFELWKRNYRYKRGEIDLIVRNNKLIVFIEVKYRSSNAFGHPEEFVSDQQKALIIESANHFITEEDWQGNIRFDIAAVDGSMQIEIFEDAFY